ncbi:MAG: uridylate kinase [Hyphomicrobium sp.]|nr:uridylate kinase [Hyphomicrobium sp.]
MAEQRQALPLVIKAGGSLAETGRLARLLSLIAAAKRPVVVVPGGGAFADKVRERQQALGFDDATAHRQAMRAMHQMADVFVTLCDRLRVTDTVEGIGGVLRSGQIPVWVPLPTLDGDASIPADWSITSDGIAARLAELLGGAPLVLLKSVDVDANASAQRLAEAGVIDTAFPGIAARAGLDWRIFGAASDAALAALLAEAPNDAAKS